MPKYSIEVINLTKAYRRRPVVCDVSLVVHKAEIYGILGPNGAGKTTLINMLVGLTQPTNGKIRILDYALGSSPIEIKRRIGHVYANMAFFLNLTAEQNLKFFGRFYRLRGTQLQSRVAELLVFVGLAAEARKIVGHFSQGMKQRLGIARALINDPQIVFLDEATTGIDVRGTRAIRRLMYDLRAEGRTIVIAGHELDEIELICDRIALLDEGNLLVVGAPSEVKRGLKGSLYKYRVHVPRAIPAEVGLGAEVCFLGNSSILVAKKDLSRILQARYGAEAVEILEPTLEDVFLWHLDQQAEKQRMDGA